jgi:hypothetical protein
MVRILFLAVIALATVFPTFAQSVRVDGTSIPVPERLRAQWHQVESRETWHTERGDRIDGHFQRFVVRRFDLFRNDKGALHVRVSWFGGGKCHQNSTPVRLLPEKKKHFLRTLFGRFEAITAPVSQVVTFCEFTGAVVPPGTPRPEGPDENPTEPAEPPSRPVGPTENPSEPAEAPVGPTEPPAEPGDLPGDLPVGPTEPPADPGDLPGDLPVGPTEPPAEPGDLPGDLPVGPTEPPAEPGDLPVGPTEPPAEPADLPVGPTSPPESPEGPTSPPESPEGPTTPPESPDGPTSPPERPDGPTSPPESPDGPGDENPAGPNGGSTLIPFIRMAIPAKNLLAPFAALARQSFSNRFAVADCTSGEGEGDDEHPGEKPPGDEDPEDENERPKHFGFRVLKYVSPPGSIQFSLAGERDVCIHAENLGAAARIIHKRFRPHIRPTTRERVAYRILPTPSACRPPERPEHPEGDGKLEPIQDPGETNARETPAESVDIPV